MSRLLPRLFYVEWQSAALSTTTTVQRQFAVVPQWHFTSPSLDRRRVDCRWLMSQNLDLGTYLRLRGHFIPNNKAFTSHRAIIHLTYNYCHIVALAKKLDPKTHNGGGQMKSEGAQKNLGPLTLNLLPTPLLGSLANLASFARGRRTQPQNFQTNANRNP